MMTPGRSAAVAGDGDASVVHPVIDGEGVVKEYTAGGETVRALRDIDFSIDPGKFVAIVGPSGSGKSTLLGLVGSLLGAPLALGITALINDALLSGPLAFTVQALQYIAAGVLFGIVASMVGGLYPAWKAARERPVEALRG